MQRYKDIFERSVNTRQPIDAGLDEITEEQAEQIKKANNLPANADLEKIYGKRVRKNSVNKEVPTNTNGSTTNKNRPGPADDVPGDKKTPKTGTNGEPGTLYPDQDLRALLSF
jgi:hypothetical protein